MDETMAGQDCGLQVGPHEGFLNGTTERKTGLGPDLAHFRDRGWRKWCAVGLGSGKLGNRNASGALCSVERVFIRDIDKAIDPKSAGQSHVIRSPVLTSY